MCTWVRDDCFNDNHRDFISDLYDDLDKAWINCSGTAIWSSEVSGILTSYGYYYQAEQNYSISVVVGELSVARPVYMDGSNGTSGHAWVCDGYRRFDTYRCDLNPWTQEYEKVLYSTGSPYLHFKWDWWFDWDDGWYASWQNWDTGEGNFHNNNDIIKIIHN